MSANESVSPIKSAAVNLIAHTIILSLTVMAPSGVSKAKRKYSIVIRHLLLSCQRQSSGAQALFENHFDLSDFAAHFSLGEKSASLGLDGHSLDIVFHSARSPFLSAFLSLSARLLAIAFGIPPAMYFSMISRCAGMPCSFLFSILRLF
jgi:hypothetical protein